MTHKFIPDKYKEDDEIKVNGEFKLTFDEIKFNCSKISNYSEKQAQVKIKFDSEFIKGTKDFKSEIDTIFFSELFSTNLCTRDIIEENIYISRDLVYSCINNENMLKKIQKFPTIYFQLKEKNLTFLFNYKELFKLHNDRLYFLIIFKNDTYNTWDIGDIFLKKYITSFNADSKTISFYKNQVDEINVKTDIPYQEDTETDKGTNKEDNVDNDDNDGDSINILRLVVEILMGVIIIVVIILLIVKFKSTRKKKANELNDEYEYESVN